MNLVELESVDSTNTYAKKIASEGAPENTVVWAHEQTAGRGRQGNNWVSPVGNLYMSMVLRPKADARYLGQLAFLSAVAILNVLENNVSDKGIQLKWPNDILLNGKKLGGILIESDHKEGWVIVGMGINVVSAPQGSAALSDLGFHSFTTERLLHALVDEMKKLLAQWENTGFDTIRERWLSHAYKIGKQIRARLSRQDIRLGTFRGIDAEGNLLLEEPSGRVLEINSGEVFL